MLSSPLLHTLHLPDWARRWFWMFPKWKLSLQTGGPQAHPAIADVFIWLVCVFKKYLNVSSTSKPQEMPRKNCFWFLLKLRRSGYPGPTCSNDSDVVRPERQLCPHPGHADLIGCPSTHPALLFHFHYPTVPVGTWIWDPQLERSQGRKDFAFLADVHGDTVSDSLKSGRLMIKSIIHVPESRMHKQAKWVPFRIHNFTFKPNKE